ncbi:urea ABC transporter permease subunit UrtB [Halioxenophilus sp. WMMB6]|uniref:urea ABC transporter permease subunit UrtB n=1 Tax=Halioxenophilus sp. WMMB6 TaxID=3073815 RepID=UPI00295ECFDC|nr:urea ABC transporter permease subunit UrtB [Halioxenophilus sp. WMMB6]
MRKIFRIGLSLLIFVVFSPLTRADDAEVQALLHSLTEASLNETADIITQLEEAGGDSMMPLFETLLAGDLYYEKESKQLMLATKNDEGYSGAEVFTGADLGQFERGAVKKIRVNNALRTQLREAIARINLSAESAQQRLHAVQTMLGELDESSAQLIQERIAVEADSDVLAALREAYALYQLKSSADDEQRLAAIAQLTGSLEPDVRVVLTQLLETNGDGEFIESSAPVRAAAATALKKIESKISFYSFLEQLFFGLSLGSVLLLAAIGLAITFGVMGVINMAHGEMMMLGAYTTFAIQEYIMPGAIGYSLLVAIPLAFLVSGSVGVVIERTVIRFLHGRPLETLLATFGISLILQEVVKAIFTPLNRQVITPQWMSGSLEINSVFSITYNRLYILIFALLLFFALQLIMKKTSLGLNVRAVSQNRNMAKAIGIKTDRVDALTFGLGSGIAGIAGVALSQITNVGPNLGQSYIIDSFMVVVFGGVGNLMGTLVGGFTLGVANKFLEPATGAVLAKILILVFIILFIQKRPKGLFPQKGRAAND